MLPIILLTVYEYFDCAGALRSEIYCAILFILYKKVLRTVLVGKRKQMAAEGKSKFTLMTTEPVERLVFKMAVPTIISMLVTALYNIVDTFFVGRIGNEATAGVGLVLPMMAVMHAFGFFFGMGSGNYISRSLGAQETDKAETMAATGCFSALLFGVLILALGLTFKGALLYVLGARETLLDALTVRCAGEYLTIILCGAPFLCVSCVMNNQLRFQGNAFFSMIGLVSGAVLNCVLDPIFIFTLGLGVRGAAYATVLGQIASCALLYTGTLRSDSLKLHIKNFRPNAYYLKNICLGGVPSLFRQGLSSVTAMVLNAAAASAVTAELATPTVAAFTVVNKISMLAFSAVIGFGQGFQPICGFNYGAKRYDRVCAAFRFCVKLATVFLIVMGVLCWIFAGDLVGIFRDDPDVIAIGTVIMRCQGATFWLVGLIVMTNMLYQNIGRMVSASVLASARNGLFLIPAVLILPRVITPAVWGVYLAQPVSDVLAFAIALPLAIKMYRELTSRQSELDKEETK